LIVKPKKPIKYDKIWAKNGVQYGYCSHLLIASAWLLLNLSSVISFKNLASMTSTFPVDPQSGR
jgi:hypothetical protein